MPWTRCPARSLFDRRGALIAALLALVSAPVHAIDLYWNVFNVEGESSLTAQIVTYGSRADMLNDQNRTGLFTPNSAGFGRNIVGSGAVVTRSQAVPESGQTLVLLGIAVGLTLGIRRMACRSHPWVG